MPIRPVLVWPALMAGLLGMTAAQAEFPGVLEFMADTAKQPAPEEAGRSTRDSVVWGDDPAAKPAVDEASLEYKGERYGLVGPIVASSGDGRKDVIAVFDPAGVLVGTLSRKEADQHPDKLKNLVRIAAERGRVEATQAIRRIEADQR